MSFYKECWECGRQVSIEEQVCSKCGYDFTTHPQIKPICPYCEKELHLEDFFTSRLDKKGQKRRVAFIGERSGFIKMWYCPFCGKILAFSDAATGS